MVAQFIAEEGPLKGQIFSLEGGEEWLIGRDIDECTISLEDLSVSRKHLLCRKTEDGYFVTNLSTTHPIQINDKVVGEETKLVEHDLLQIGASLFRFYLEPPEGPLEELAGQQEEAVHDAIYQEVEEEPRIDFTISSRFLLKVIAGVNTGAEFALELGHDYVIGTDSAVCDIVFHDLSISKEHARLSVSSNGQIFIEDLDSKNGVIIDREIVKGKRVLLANTIVTLGTTLFLIIDREKEAETIIAPSSVYELPREVEREPAVEEKKVEVKEKPKKSAGPMIFSLILIGLIVLLGIGVVSLFQVKEMHKAPRDYMQELQQAFSNFPKVEYTFNSTTGKLFIVGHVATAVRKSELLYNLRGLDFIKGVEDNVVNDEAIWQETNILLSKNPDFKGISMHSPEAGLFVITGYLQTEKQAQELSDYINVHFNYLSNLDNRVIIEERVLKQISASLLTKGYGAVEVTFVNGELLLTGFADFTQSEQLKTLAANFLTIPGVRYVKNFVVMVSPESGVVDLDKRFPDRYKVTGYSKKGNVNINVVINGRILTRGDVLDDMTITSIQPKVIYFEKDGLVYKLNYKQ